MSIDWQDSTTYQLILNKGIMLGLAESEARGRVLEAQELVLALATHRFGAADAPREAALRQITDRERLHRLALRIGTAADWDDLLATP